MSRHITQSIKNKYIRIKHNAAEQSHAHISQDMVYVFMVTALNLQWPDWLCNRVPEEPRSSYIMDSQVQRCPTVYNYGRMLDN